MKIPHEEEAKYQALNEQNVLYRKADTVSDELFQTLDFFDPHDLIQVKYEMVRRVQKEGWSVTRAASAFGFSRISYYTIQHAIETHGLVGLMPRKRGPKQPTKITDAVLKFIEQQLEQDPTLSSQKMRALVIEELGVEVHKRTIERTLQRKKKTAAAPPLSAPAQELERAYEQMRMKVLQAGDLIHSQSQLVFGSKGMKGWLETVANMTIPIERVKYPTQQVSIPPSVGKTAVVLLADMALNTWKEVCS